MSDALEPVGAECRSVHSFWVKGDVALAIYPVQRTQQIDTELQYSDRRAVGSREIALRNAEPLFTRQSLFCVFLLAASLLVIWPVAEIGINDDWSYIRTAQLFAQTGRFIYNGWATAMLGWQVVWGALFSRLFGPSFSAVRMALVPIDLVTALLFHAVLRRFGLNKNHATLGTLTIVLSPLFLPLGTTFMSDVPGLFTIVLCVYLCQLALAASTDRAAWGWLVTAALTNMALGTVRQTAWLGLLVIVPSCGWLLRRRRFVLPLTLGLWLIGLVWIRLAISWFQRQPYSVPERILVPVNPFALKWLLDHGCGAVLTLMLLCLPALATCLPALFPLRRRAVIYGGVIGILFFSILVVFKHHHESAVLGPPWLAPTIDYTGLRLSCVLLSPRSAPTAAMLIFLVCCFLCVWAFLKTTLDRPYDRSQQPHVQWHTISVLLLPYLLSYSLLLVPRSLTGHFVDRYLMAIVPVVLVYILGWHQERVSARIPVIAIVVLVLSAWVGVASTHDLFARERARVQLIDELQRAGIPRTSIRGGFSFDGITQIDAWGYVNEAALVNPPGAYHRHPIETGPCAYWFDDYVPVIHARYVAETEPTRCAGPSTFSPIVYRTWFPPRTAYVWAGTLTTNSGQYWP